MPLIDFTIYTWFLVGFINILLLKVILHFAPKSYQVDFDSDEDILGLIIVCVFLFITGPIALVIISFILAFCFAVAFGSEAIIWFFKLGRKEDANNN